MLPRHWPGAESSQVFCWMLSHTAQKHVQSWTQYIIKFISYDNQYQLQKCLWENKRKLGTFSRAGQMSHHSEFYTIWIIYPVDYLFNFKQHPFCCLRDFFPMVIGIFQYYCLVLGEGYIFPFVTSSYSLTLKRKVRQPSWFSAMSAFRSELFPWLTSGLDQKSQLRMLWRLGLINKLIGLRKGTWCAGKALRRKAIWTAQ